MQEVRIQRYLEDGERVERSIWSLVSGHVAMVERRAI